MNIIDMHRAAKIVGTAGYQAAERFLTAKGVPVVGETPVRGGHCRFYDKDVVVAVAKDYAAYVKETMSTRGRIAGSAPRKPRKEGSHPKGSQESRDAQAKLMREKWASPEWAYRRSKKAKNPVEDTAERDKRGFRMTKARKAALERAHEGRRAQAKADRKNRAAGVVAGVNGARLEYLIELVENMLLKVGYLHDEAKGLEQVLEGATLRVSGERAPAIERSDNGVTM